MPRAAICLSGLVRTYRLTYQNLVDALLEPNRDWQVDFFISTWPVEHSNNSMERARRIAWTQGAAPPFPEDAIDFNDLQARYRPVAMLVEAPIEFETPSWYVKTPGLHIQSILSMMHKIQSADRLRRQHEATHKFKYDVVVRHRFDTIIPMTIKFDEVASGERLWVPSMMQARWHPDHDWCNDKFAASPGHRAIGGDRMEKYCDWIDSLGWLVTKCGLPIQPEILLHAHLSIWGIKTLPLGTEFELIRIPGF